MTTCTGCLAWTLPDYHGANMCPLRNEVVKVVKDGFKTKRPRNGCERPSSHSHLIALKQLMIT